MNHVNAFKLALCASLLALLACGPAAARGLYCGNHSIEGTYGIQVQGTRAVPENLGGGSEAVVGVVMRTYDGRGRFEQIGNVRGATTGMPVDAPGSGTYIVLADCTGRTTFQPFGPSGPTLTEHFLIVRNGQEMRTITAPPGPLVTAVALRVDGE